MPFFSREGSSERAEVALRVVGDRTFQITAPFWYQYPGDINPEYRYEGPGVEIKAHQGDATTDLASVPTLLWGVVASYGKQLLPALLHDQRCEDVRNAPKDRRFQLRSQADHEFHRALAEVGVSRMRRRVFWVGVALGKYLAHGRARGALLLFPHIVIGMVALVGMVCSVLGWHWFGWKTRQFAIVLGASLVASVFWWRDWRLPAVAILAGPPLLAAMGVSYVAALIVFITDGAEQAFRIMGKAATSEPASDTKRPETAEATAR